MLPGLFLYIHVTLLNSATGGYIYVSVTFLVTFRSRYIIYFLNKCFYNVFNKVLYIQPFGGCMHDNDLSITN